MNCREIKPWLLAEPDGALTAEQRSALSRHVAGCTACRLLQADLHAALDTYRADSARVALPDVDTEWRKLRAQLPVTREQTGRERRLAPVIWFSAPLAAAAALALGYFGFNNTPVETAGVPETARADFVEAGNANASTMVYVDKDSGWLVVWATDDETKTSG